MTTRSESDLTMDWSFMVDLKAVIFDMDGTLIDSEVLWVEAMQLFMGREGVEVSWDEAIQIVYGHCWPEVYAEALRRYPELGRYTIHEMSQAMQPDYRRMREERDIRLHSSIDLLKALARDYPVCIVSGSPRHGVEEAVEHMGIGECLDFILGAENYDQGKPAPDGFLEAAKILEVEPGQCLVFEDSRAGVVSAKAAGMICVALARPERPAQDVSMADLVLPDLGEFSMEELNRVS